MAQNTIQNSSWLYPEDVIVYISTAKASSVVNDLADLYSTNVTWINVGALSEYNTESAVTSVTPPSFNVEHRSVISKEAETINVTLQELNSSIVNVMSGGRYQLLSTSATTIGLAAMDVVYAGGFNGTLEPFYLWEYAKYSDGRSRSRYFPSVNYVSGGSPQPKAQGTGEYMTMPFTLEARESTSVIYNSRFQYKIEVYSTNSSA